MAKPSDILAKNVDGFLALRSWTRSDFARAMKMSPSQLSGYLLGKNSPTLLVLERMAKTLDVHLHLLVKDPQVADHPIEECYRRIGVVLGRERTIRERIQDKDVPSVEELERILEELASEGDATKKTAG